MFRFEGVSFSIGGITYYIMQILPQQHMSVPPPPL